MKRVLMVVPLVLLPACSDSTAPRPATIVEFETSASGEDTDIDGYRIIVDDKTGLAINAFGLIRVQSLAPGVHTFRVEGVAENCSLEGPGQRHFTVAAAKTVRVKVQVACEATGVTITTITRGVDIPLDGYEVKVGGLTQRVPATGKVIVSRIRAGDQVVSLTPADNCSASGSSRSVSIENRKLTPVSFELECATVPMEIAFTSFFASAGSVIGSLFTATGTGTHQFGLLRNASRPAWSPDGKKLAYSTLACEYYGPCRGGLHVMDVESRVHVELTEGSLATDPAWSPDGKSLAVVLLNQFSYDLAIMSGTRVERIPFTRVVYGAGSPTWSPDGTRIAFACHLPPTSYQICVTTLGSNDYTELTTGPAWKVDPAWSPDGRTIAFMKTPQGGGPVQIAVISADGGPEKILADGTDPAWSPNGSKLIFSGHNGLFTMNPDGSGMTRITTGLHREPSWRP